MWRFRTYLMVLIYSWVCEKRYNVVLAPAQGPGGAPNTVAPFSTPMMTPRKAATLAHLGIHISWRASRQRSCEPTESRAGTWRKATIPDSPGKVPRQAYGEGPGRKRSGLPSIRSRGVVIGRARLAAVPSPSHLHAHLLARPPPPPCVCLCVCFCAVCALRDVSPRDRWLCVLPGWQMNVNVNVNVVLAAICGIRS